MSENKASAKAPEKGERVSYELMRVVTRPDGSIDHERTELLDPSSVWDDEYATIHRLVGLLDATGGEPMDAASSLNWMAGTFEEWREDVERARDWTQEAAEVLAHLEDDFGPMLRRIAGGGAE